jgi:RNA polymerase sigma-70 factor (ECF subfamily)
MAMDSDRTHRHTPTAPAPPPQGAADRRALAASFEDFFEIEHAGLFGSLVLLTRDRADAEELMQDAFLKVWERWDLVQGLDDPTGYLYRTAMNAAFSRRRRATVAARHLIRPDPKIDGLERVDDRDRIDRALDRLTPRQRATIILSDLLGFPSPEVASAMRITPSTVRVLLARARAIMREELGS